MANNNTKTVQTWKLLLVLLIVIWLINVGVSAYLLRPFFFSILFLKCTILGLIQTGLIAFICYIFYVLFFKHKEEAEKAEEVK